MITKSGSSRLHGTAFWFGQGIAQRHDARRHCVSSYHHSPEYEHKVGGTLGGPLGKKDTFFFLSYQYDRSRSDLSNVYPVIATAPTAAGLTALLLRCFAIAGFGHDAGISVRFAICRRGQVFRVGAAIRN